MSFDVWSTPLLDQRTADAGLRPDAGWQLDRELWLLDCYDYCARNTLGKALTHIHFIIINHFISFHFHFISFHFHFISFHFHFHSFHFISFHNHRYIIISSSSKLITCDMELGCAFPWHNFDDTTWAPVHTLTIHFVVSIHPSVRPSVRRSVCPSVRLSVCPSAYLSISLSVYLSICLSFYLSIYLSVRLSMSLCLSLCLCLSVCVSVCLPVCLSVCVSVCLSVCLSVCVSVCLSVCLSVCVSLSVSLSVSVCRSVRPSIHVSIRTCACQILSTIDAPEMGLSENMVPLNPPLSHHFPPIFQWQSPRIFVG